MVCLGKQCKPRSDCSKTVWSGYTLFATASMHCYMLKLSCSNFRKITAIISSIPILHFLQYSQSIWAASWQNQQNDFVPSKTQVSLGIRPVWSESLLCAQWVAKDPSFLHADSEDSDQTERMPRLIWVFAGITCHFVGFVMKQLIWVK